MASIQVLRQSLDETQRRCESFSSEMLQLVEANDGLVETLGTVTDANKKLLTQILVQTDEIARLTRQHVGDGERCEQLVRQRASEEEAVRRASRRQGDDARGTVAERWAQLRGQLVERLRRTQARSGLLHNDAERLKLELQERRRDAQMMMAEFRERLETAASDILAHLTPHLQQQAQQAAQLQEAVAEAKLQLQAEAEARREESLAWNLKHGSLATDREDVQARMARECSQLSSQLRAGERARQADQQAWTEERAALEQQLQEQLKQKNAQELALEQLQRETTRLEGAVSAASMEIEGLEQSVTEQRRRAREADDALAAAVGGNEHLQQQIREQRARFQERNEAELNDCRVSYERRLAGVQLSQEADDAMSKKELEALELDSQARAGELHGLQARETALAETCQALERDLASWRAQCETANNLREHHEKEFNEAKRQFQDDRLQLQAAAEALADRVAALEEEVSCLANELQSARRRTLAGEAERQARRAGEESLLRETRELLRETKARLVVASEQRLHVESEASAGRARAQTMHAALERELEEQTKTERSAVQRLVARLESEQGAARQLREDLACERQSVLQALQRLQSESHAEITGAERERMRVEEACRAGLAQAGELVAQQRRREEELRRELSRVQGLLAECEANLKRVKQEGVTNERDVALELRWHREALQRVGAQLELGRSQERALIEQLETQRRRRKEAEGPFAHCSPQLGLLSRGGPDAGAGGAVGDGRAGLRAAPMTAR